ncbi:hypothetical protein ACQEUX_19920 [Micromonospora sp. CA-259024]|uniref:hypothetical protein n=1 Tax=Micromonospora sp. CA-259024 TaxID=3239965 RepID=UPI003D91D1A1
MNHENSGPPVRFVDAERINPFQVLLDLHDHALGHPAAPSQRDALTELALAAAVVSWWSRWQPITIHAALRSGADLTDIVAATGLGLGEVVRRWQRWADVQTLLIIGGRTAVDPEEVRTIRRQLRTGMVR